MNNNPKNTEDENAADASSKADSKKPDNPNADSLDSSSKNPDQTANPIPGQPDKKPEDSQDNAASAAHRKSEPSEQGRKISLIIAGLLFAAMLICFVLIWLLGVLPRGILITAGLILLVVFLIALIMLIRRSFSRPARIVIRVVGILLLGGFVIADYTLANTYFTLRGMTGQKITTIKTSLIVMDNSNIKEVKDLSDKTVGYSEVGDQEANSAAMAKINQDTDRVNYQAATDYYELYEELEAGKIDALLLPTNRISMLHDQYKDIEEKTRVLEEFSSQKTTFTAANSNVNITREPFAVYIAGIDEGDDPSLDTRADVNILLMVDPVNNRMTTVSIPRDSFVPNPAYDNGSDKLTHLGNDGVENSIRGIEETFGVEINYYAKVNFQSLIHIVDALGGIDVDVKLSFTEQDENRSFKKDDLIVLNEGMQTLNGKQALAYARHRKTEGYGTTGREQAQQQVIRAIMKKLTTADGISRINDLLNVASEYVYTNIPMDSIQSFISSQIEHVRPWTIDSITLKTGVTANLTTASMPGIPLSCYLLSDLDVLKVYNAYMRMYDDSKLKDFTFSLVTNPALAINYKTPLEPGKYLITAEDLPYLSSYVVYYGLEETDDTASESAERRAEESDIPIVVPSYTPSQSTNYPTQTTPNYNYNPGSSSSSGSSSSGSSSGSTGGSSGGSTTVPVVPDTPTVPDTPVVPDSPVVPDTPTVPDTPIIPDVPVESGQSSAVSNGEVPSSSVNSQYAAAEPSVQYQPSSSYIPSSSYATAPPAADSESASD